MIKTALVAVCLTACQPGCGDSLSSTPIALVVPAVEPGVYKMISGDYVCTAWAVQASEPVWHGDTEYDRYDLAITAGHCCDGRPGETVQLTTSEGLSVPAQPLVWEASWGPEADICVLRVVGPTQPGLVLAENMPPVMTPDHYVGYPEGKHAIADGTYLGVRDGAAYSTAVAHHGASGAPLYTAAGVYAIVVQISPAPDDNGTGSDSNGCTGTPVTEIRRVLALIK